MKKLMATALSLAMVMSFAACGKKETDSSGSSGNETGPVASIEETDPEASATTEFVNAASQYVKDAREKYKSFEMEDCEIHVPDIQIKSGYVDSINKEIEKIFEGYKKAIASGDDEQYPSTEYVAYLSDSGVLSVVFIELGVNDLNTFHVYNIDIKTGEKVDNARLAQIAGVKSIRQAAMDALQNFYNKLDINVQNYKVVKEGGKALDEEEKAVEQSFGEKYLNDNMMIGLTNEGKLFFISEMCVMAGTDFFNYMYDGDGEILNACDNPYRVGIVYDDDAEEGTIDPEEGYDPADDADYGDDEGDGEE